jgi:hypothetical protein
MADQLAERFTVLDRVPVPVEWDDVLERRDAPVPLLPDAPRRPARHRLAVIAAVLALLVALAAIVGSLDGPEDNPPRVTTPTTDAPSPSTLPATRTSRTFPVTVWTGEQYLVWGGEGGDGEASARADGFAYDPATDEVTDIPVAPIGPRSSAAGVWSGEELLVCCGYEISSDPARDTATAAAYDPDARTWRRLPAPPAGTDRAFGAAVWTGDEMIVVFGANEGGEGLAVAYDPDTDTWTQLATPPGTLSRIPESAWTGDAMIVWSGEGPDRGYQYDPAADEWSSLPDLPAAAATRDGSIAWTGSEIVVYGQAANDETRAVGARWRPGDENWRPISDAGLPPIEWYEGTPGSQSVVWDDASQRVIVWPTRGDEYAPDRPAPLLAYDPATDTWSRLGPTALGFHPQLIAAEGRLLQADSEHPIAFDLDP